MAFPQYFRTGVYLTALLVFALALRLTGIGNEPMWIDEAASVGIGSLPWSLILGEFARVEASPPGYYLLAALVHRIAADDLVALRVVSAVAGALVSVPVFLALWAEGERPAAWIAALFLAMAATLVRLSGDARCYALLTLCLALGFQAALALARARRLGQTGWTPALLLGLAMAAGIWLHATAGLLAVGLNAAALAATGLSGWLWVLPRLVLANSAALLLAALPLFFIAQHVLADAPFIARWISPPGLAETVLLYGRTLVAPWQAPFSALTAGLFAVGLGLAGLAALRGHSPAASGALALAGFGLLAFPLVSQWRPVMLDRTVLPLLVPLAVLIGLGFTRLTAWPRLGLGMAGMFLALQAYGTQGFLSIALAKEQWPALAAHHAETAAPDDVLVIPDSVFLAIAFADAARRQGLAVPPMLVVPAWSPLEQAAARHLAPWRAMTPAELCTAMGPRSVVWVANRPLPPAVAADPGFTTQASILATLAAAGARPASAFQSLKLDLQRWTGPVCVPTP